ncbi:hypothetical protein [Aquimarina sp. 2201CG14-23]|nr:hypothetical protein [Aquimarina sp. 2201CG14-23]MDH7446443.1 hypothetical protein [Aquimarina sp. 2201CG14-23]
MISRSIYKENTKERDNKIKITRLKEMNIAYNVVLSTSERLAKAYNINI